MPDKPKFETPDLTAENVAKIAALFPGAVVEGKVNFDLLRSLLGEDVFGDEAYEFTWVGKRAAIAEAGRPIRKTLRPCPDESRDWETTENLYIEGDNLEALKLLQESYLGQVKMIYIDPPYNTGKDFIYRDNFTQSREEYDEEAGVYDEGGDRLFRNTETNGRFHSDWCSMIYPRLVLARNLLRDDGVIFISIDDGEVAQLRKISDEVFGESNFVAQWNWYKSATPPNLSKKVKKNIEYILCYEKNGGNGIKYKGILKTSESNNGLMNQSNAVGTLVFPAGKVDTKLKNGKYHRGIYGTKNYKIELLKDTEAQDDYFVKDVVLKGKFKWTQENLNQELENGTTVSIKTEAFSPSYEKAEYDPEAPPNLIDDTLGVDTTENAGKYQKELFDGKIVFSYPKSVTLLRYIIGFNDCEDGVILDFFSGSATTAHAVMELNATVGGRRKFIMIQWPENLEDNLRNAVTESEKQIIQNAINVCDEMGKPHFITEIGKERIRRAGDKIKNEAGLTAPGLDVGFRVLKVADTNMTDVYYEAGDYTQDMLTMMQSNIKPDRTDMDLLFGCLLDWGLPLSRPHTRENIDGFAVHTYNGGDLMACFEERVSEKAIREIAGRQPLRAVFRDSGFAGSPEKINVFEIFKLLAPNTTVKVI